MHWLRNPPVILVLVLTGLLFVVDLLNHWASPAKLTLQFWWLLPIWPALRFPPGRGILVTFACGLIAEAYTGYPQGTLLFVLLILHLTLFVNRDALSESTLWPNLAVAPICLGLGTLFVILLTPTSLLTQGGFWLGILYGLIYNLIAFLLLAPLLYRLLQRTVDWADRDTEALTA